MAYEKLNFGRAALVGLPPAPAGKRTYYGDTKEPGLLLCVTGTGTKSFQVYIKQGGKPTRVTLGRFSPNLADSVELPAGCSHSSFLANSPELNVRMARSLAAMVKIDLKAGCKPADLKRAARTEADRQGQALADAWPVYMKARKSKWGDRHYQDHFDHTDPGGKSRNDGKGLSVAGPLAKLMPLPLGELTSKRISEWLEDESKTRPTYVALSYRLLRAFIRWAANEDDYKGIIPADAYSAQIVKEAVPRGRTKEGDSLQREQLELWFAAVRKLPSLAMSTYLQALLITGARREEMLGLKWSDVDLQWRSLTIRDKIEGQRTIPLPPYLASLLLELKRQNETPPNVHKILAPTGRDPEWKPSPWVFSSDATEDGKLPDPRRSHVKVLEEAGLPHVSIQGLRRSFGTLCEWVEVPAGISAQIMGHKPSAIAEKHYRRRPIDLLRMWHDKIEAWVLEQAGIEFSIQANQPILKKVI